MHAVTNAPAHQCTCCCRDDEERDKEKLHEQHARQQATAKVAALTKPQLAIGKDSSAWALPSALWEPIMAALTGASRAESAQS